MASTRSRGDAVLRTGAAVSLIGVALSLIAMAPLVIPSLVMPSAWWFLSVPVTGVGVVIVSIGLALSGRDRRRAASALDQR